MLPKSLKRCHFCWKAFATQRAVNQHISASKICLKEWHKKIVRNEDNLLAKCRRINSPEPSWFHDFPNVDPTHLLDDANVEDANNRDDDDLAIPKRYVEEYPGRAGEALRQEKTQFEIVQEKHHLEGKTPWELFASREEWGLVEWLMKNVGQKSTDDYLQLPIVSWLFVQVKKKLSFSKVNSCNNLLFHNNYTFLKRIDQLPTGPEWICDVVTITGNIVDDNGVCIE